MLAPALRRARYAMDPRRIFLEKRREPEKGLEWLSSGHDDQPVSCVLGTCTVVNKQTVSPSPPPPPAYQARVRHHRRRRRRRLAVGEQAGAGGGGLFLRHVVRRGALLGNKIICRCCCSFEMLQNGLCIRNAHPCAAVLCHAILAAAAPRNPRLQDRHFSRVPPGTRSWRPGLSVLVDLVPGVLHLRGRERVHATAHGAPAHGARPARVQQAGPPRPKHTFPAPFCESSLLTKVATAGGKEPDFNPKAQTTLTTVAGRRRDGGLPLADHGAVQGQGRQRDGGRRRAARVKTVEAGTQCG